MTKTSYRFIFIQIGQSILHSTYGLHMCEQLQSQALSQTYRRLRLFVQIVKFEGLNNLNFENYPIETVVPTAYILQFHSNTSIAVTLIVVLFTKTIQEGV